VWNGLTGVDEDGADGAVAYYIDGRPFLYLPSPKEYSATLKAYTFPDEFLELIGFAEATSGMYLDSQMGDMFDLSYRTSVGNDLDGISHAYKIHLIYNATATPAAKSYESLSDSINPIELSFALQAVPVKVTGFRPTAHVIIDSRSVAPAKLSSLEDELYGTATTNPSIPTAQAVFDLLSA